MSIWNFSIFVAFMVLDVNSTPANAISLYNLVVFPAIKTSSGSTVLSQVVDHVSTVTLV